jgi:hypothetical protein
MSGSSLVWPVAAQEGTSSDAQRLRQTQFELNVCDLSARHARKTLTEELRQAVERGRWRWHRRN